MAEINGGDWNNANTLQKLLNIAKDTSVSVLIEGEHGIGKSDGVREFAKNNEYHLEILLLGNQELGDLVGIPKVSTDKHGHEVTMWTMPIWLKRMWDAYEDHGTTSVLFLDELNRSQIEVRQSALQIVLDKMLHQHHLPPQTIVVSAINPADGDYQVDELDPALYDRFIHYRLQPNADSWLVWAESNGIHRTIRNYISNNKDKMYVKDKNANIYPTPRSWAKLSELLVSYEKYNVKDDQLIYDLIVGKIGASVGVAFKTYYEDNNKIVTVADVAAIVEKAYKKKGDDASKFEGAIKAIDKMINTLDDIVLLRELTDNMVKEYLWNDDQKDKIPVRAYLMAVPLEQLGTLIKQLRTESTEGYERLRKLDTTKDIFRRVATQLAFALREDTK